MSITFGQLSQDATDRAVEYGVILRKKETSEETSYVQQKAMQLFPITLWPSVYPKKHYEFLLQVQMDYNLLVDKLSSDVLLMESLQRIIQHDDFVRRLVEIYNKVSLTKQQPISIAIQRCDYLLHIEHSEEADSGIRVAPKLVEMNTIAPAFAAITENVANVHKVLQVKYQDGDFKEQYRGQILDPDAVSMVCRAMAIAWKEYGQPKAAILMVINENESNIFELGKFELKLAIEYQIKVLRHTFGELDNVATIKSDNRLIVNDTEIAIVYYRSGYHPNLFPTEKQWSAYLMLEQSQAVKCPPISHHLCTLKRIQQVFSNPNVLESFFNDPTMLERIKSTLVGLYPLDEGPEGDEVIEMALKNPEKFVLKTQREATAKCYLDEDEDIREKLTQILKMESRVTYTLMDRINYPTQEYAMVGNDSKHHLLQTCPEIGIFGVFVRNGEKVLMNSSAGYSVRHVSPNMDEINSTGGALSSLMLTPS
ncbi:glutathione synthetase-like isoform X2 [Dysidea avara]|uniref:glutathione synthetase-like isoform X2 n=1 Tax=Dysidea avara TaxID=196820 RepID=UPI00332D7854